MHLSQINRHSASRANANVLPRSVRLASQRNEESTSQRETSRVRDVSPVVRLADCKQLNAEEKDGEAKRVA